MARPRQIVAGSSKRPDLLMHALAQLPDAVDLQLDGSSEDRPQLEALARAYGITDRVEFGRSTDASVPPHATMAELVEAISEPDDPPADSARRGIPLNGERIALVTNIPAPYRMPLFRTMNDRLTTEGASFRVFFLSGHSERSWMNAQPEGFEYELLSALRVPVRRRAPLLPTDLERRLSGFQPTILVAGSLSPLVAGRAARFARRRAISFGVWSGEIETMPTARSRVRRAQRRRLLQHADFGLAYGFRAAEYLRSLRPGLPVVYARNTSVVVTEPRRREPSATVELLAVGDLASPRKGIDVAVDALHLSPELDCRLTVVGGGKLLGEAAGRAGNDGRIRFVGAQPPAEVRRHYEEADALLFPTRADVYGLVVPEAMAAGLAVVTASNPGAVGDLAVDGYNAVIVDGHDAATWAAAIARVVGDAELRARLGEAAARSIGSRWTIAHAADAMVAGLRLGHEAGRARK